MFWSRKESLDTLVAPALNDVMPKYVCPIMHHGPRLMPGLKLPTTRYIQVSFANKCYQELSLWSLYKPNSAMHLITTANSIVLKFARIHDFSKILENRK